MATDDTLSVHLVVAPSSFPNLYSMFLLLHILVQVGKSEYLQPNCLVTIQGTMYSVYSTRVLGTYFLIHVSKVFPGLPVRVEPVIRDILCHLFSLRVLCARQRLNKEVYCRRPRIREVPLLA